MKENGEFKKVFPGGNTPRGFYSFYDQIIEDDATKIFVIKGGPGVGKSTFMYKIGLEMDNIGYNVEFHCCSSDNNSYDGLVIPEINVALLDGTAPHIVDPKNPGVVDEIVHLGDHWNEEGLRKNKQTVLSLNKEVGRLFKHAYGYLAQAKILADEIESYHFYSEALDLAGLNKLVRDLAQEIINGKTKDNNPKTRHLFASGITPEGAVNYIDTIFQNISKRIVIQGPAGTGKATLIKRLYDDLITSGYNVEAYHCSLRPEEIEHILVPELNTGIITSEVPHMFKPQPGDIIINTQQYVNETALNKYSDDMDAAKRRYIEAFERAVILINRAKTVHDEMEEYYVPNMKFDEINARREQVLERVKSYADEKENFKQY